MCRSLMVLLWCCSLAACADEGGDAPSNVALSLVRTMPADGQATVAIDTPIAATFSRSLAAGAVTNANVFVEGLDAAVSSTCSTAFIEPAQPLALGTTYTLTIADIIETRRVSFTTEGRVTSVAANIYGAFAILSDDTLWAWGDNTRGQLGVNSIDAARPSRVEGAQRWRAVAAGAEHTIAIDRDGGLWAWGANDVGQLGLGGTTPEVARAPVRVGTSSDWSAVAAGERHNLALKEDGSLWSWGFNFFGQLGLSSTENKAAPARVGDGEQFVAIAAGNSHSLAVRADGTLWAWGINGSQQLGMALGADQLAPLQVGTETAWRSVVAAGRSSLAFKTDGSLWAWGDNQTGQLGNGSKTNFVDRGVPPFQLAEAGAWSVVATGGRHSAAIDRDGALLAWGTNLSNELGLGGVVEALAPTLVDTEHTWTALAVGVYYTLAVRADGTLWEWGVHPPVFRLDPPGPADASRVSFASTPPEPVAPSLTATPGASSLVVSFVGTNFDAWHELRVAPTGGGPALLVPCASSPYTVDELVPGVTYLLTLTSHRYDGLQVESAPVSATPRGEGGADECAPYARNPCSDSGSGMQTINFYIPRRCPCPSSTTDEHDSVLNELCGLAGSGYECKTCTCP